MMVPEGNGAWRVRFAPGETGRYSWQLKLRDRTGEVVGGEGTFQAVAAGASGFVRQSAADPHYLAFDSGQGFFAIGHNLPIYHTTGQLGVEAMKKFAAAGENHNRWWMSSSGFGIEWSDRLGWYRQDVAAADRRGPGPCRRAGPLLHDVHGHPPGFPRAGWEKNPFNAEERRPVRRSGRLVHQRDGAASFTGSVCATRSPDGGTARMCSAGSSATSSRAGPNSPNEIKLPWHKEMADYLRSIDPFGHLITTSFWSHTGPEEFWELENIDIVQTHCYTNDDENVAEPVRQFCLHQWERFQKPHIFGEFGIRSHSTTADKDPEGWAIHNSLWAGLFSFCAGGPMPWWHERYIDKLDLYFHFTALASFSGDLPLGTARWEPLATGRRSSSTRPRPPEMRDAVVVPSGRWGKPEQNEFTIRRDGAIADGRSPHQLLHGAGHADLKNPPTFVVDYPEAGKFVVHVDKVSHSGLLRIWVDGDLAAERELPCGEGLGKESVWREQWKLWETTYDEDVAVDVPAGRHRIRIENFGKDWVAVSKYTLTGCKVVDRPDVLVCGMRTSELAMLWLQNKRSSWYNHAGGGKVGRVDAFELAVEGLSDGRYRLQWWETWKGQGSAWKRSTFARED